MAKLNGLMLCVTGFVLMACASTQQKKEDQVYQGIRFAANQNAAFVDDNTLYLLATGTSKPGLTGALQKAGTAKEAARQEAEQILYKHCMPQSAEYNNMLLAGGPTIFEQYQLRRKALWRGATIQHSECPSTEQEIQTCRILVRIVKKGLRHDCAKAQE